MMTIEPASSDDARAVAQIHVDAWRAAYAGIFPDDYLAAQSVDERETMWREAIDRREPELLVARLDGRVVGWISFGASRDEGAAPDAAEIWTIYLAPQHIAGGIGRALWQRARERLIARAFKSASLWVLSANARAIRFYERAGFALEAGSARCFNIGEHQIEERRYATPL